MAYILSKVGQSFNVPVHIYEADTEEDMNSINLQSVPMGSKCHIINDDKWYMLNSDGKWKAMPKGVANNEICTFLILNISSLQLIPVNVIAYRSQYGSVDPAAVVGPGIVATAVSTGVAVVFCWILNKRNS